MKTAGDILNNKNREMLRVSPDQSIKDVVGVMVKNKIGAILIEEEGRIIGIWTERDLLRGVSQPGFDPASTRVGDVMTVNLHSASYDTPISKLQDMFLGLFIRHLLIEKDNTYVGLLSIGDVTRASLLEKDQQIRELNQIDSWEYYENWGWRGNKILSKPVYPCICPLTSIELPFYLSFQPGMSTECLPSNLRLCFKAVLPCSLINNIWTEPIPSVG